MYCLQIKRDVADHARPVWREKNKPTVTDALTGLAESAPSRQRETQTRTTEASGRVATLKATRNLTFFGRDRALSRGQV